MSRERKVIVESAPKAPVYIITFSTLAALLLAFFVVLLGLGNVRDETLLDEGEGGGWSFWESFQAGFASGRNLGSGTASYYHPISDPEKDAEGRTPDARSERVRRILKKVVSSGTAVPSPIAAERVDFSLTDIHFSGDEIALNEQAERFLKEFCTGLQQDESPGDVKLCVLCIGSGSQPQEKELVLSARRAKAVEDFLQAALPATGKWSTYSWGAGADSTWTAGDNLTSTQPQVLIALLRNGG